MQASAGTYPANEGEFFPVAGGRGSAGAAGAGDEVFDLPGFEIEALDDVDLLVGILVVFEDVTRGGVLGKVEMSAVG